MIQRLVRKVMGLIKNVQCVFRLGQNGTATERQVRQHQIMVRHQDIGIIQIFPGVEKRAAVEVAAVAVGALPVIGCNLAPDIVRNLFRPVVPVAIPVS